MASPLKDISGAPASGARAEAQNTAASDTTGPSLNIQVVVEL